MKTVNSIELINILNEISPKGLQVALVKGVLRSTKYLYLREDSIFEYTNELRFEFKSTDAISLTDFQKNYINALWFLEQELN